MIFKLNPPATQLCVPSKGNKENTVKVVNFVNGRFETDDPEIIAHFQKYAQELKVEEVIPEKPVEKVPMEAPVMAAPTPEKSCRKCGFKLTSGRKHHCKAGK